MKVLVDVWFDEPESLFELSDVFELELSLLDVFELLELFWFVLALFCTFLPYCHRMQLFYWHKIGRASCRERV